MKKYINTNIPESRHNKIENLHETATWHAQGWAWNKWLRKEVSLTNSEVVYRSANIRRGGRGRGGGLGISGGSSADCCRRALCGAAVCRPRGYKGWAQIESAREGRQEGSGLKNNEMQNDEYSWKHWYQETYRDLTPRGPRERTGLNPKKHSNINLNIQAQKQNKIRESKKELKRDQSNCTWRKKAKIGEKKRCKPLYCWIYSRGRMTPLCHPARWQAWHARELPFAANDLR